ncbi:MAG: 1-deoxy-D-xylulose-5-phosphate reductoisomerase, partial [Duncaniella sp.]|nr:1-deoxy-D-xylulose-5-phosphate reductoisomerase [Duncaniella sp.]
LTLAPYALRRGGNAACIINAANEVAVRAFLEEKIRFPEIYTTITRALDAIPFIETPELEDYVATHRATVTFIEELTGCKIPLRV